MAAIDPTARIEPGATIGQDVTIGPYCTIGANVSIGDGCRLVAHVNVAGHTSIGSRTTIYPFASLGSPPQSVKYRGGPTRLVVGADCDIRENVTMNIGTEDGGGITEVGDRCFFMVGSHVAHDCKVGNNVTCCQQRHARRSRQRRRQCRVRRRQPRSASSCASAKAPCSSDSAARAPTSFPGAWRSGPLAHLVGLNVDRHAPQRLQQDRHPELSRGLSGTVSWATAANSATGSSRSPQNTPVIRTWWRLIDFIRAGKRPLTMAGDSVARSMKTP